MLLPHTPTCYLCHALACRGRAIPFRAIAFKRGKTSQEGHGTLDRTREVTHLKKGMPGHLANVSIEIFGTVGQEVVNFEDLLRCEAGVLDEGSLGGS